jgi:hypothetical protein
LRSMRKAGLDQNRMTSCHVEVLHFSALVDTGKETLNNR